MRKWVVNVLSCIAGLVLLLGISYGAIWLSTIPNPAQDMIPSLGLSPLDLGEGREAGAPARGERQDAPPPPPAGRRSGPKGEGGGRTPPTPSGSGGGGRTPSAPSRSGPSAPSRSGPPRMDSAPPPPSDTEKSPPKDGIAGSGDATAAPPPRSPCESIEEKVTQKVMLLLGCGVSTLSFCSPVIIYWSLGSNLSETITFHSLWDLIATAASCLTWLLFGITQLHIEGNRVFGAETVLVNLLGLIVYTLCTVIKTASNANVRTKGCLGAVFALCGPIFVVLYLTVFGPLKRNSLAAVWISFGAALVQMFTQFLPFRSIVLLYHPAADAPPQHPSTKKLIIFSRSCNLVVCVYWAVYCVFTYKHDFFEWANVASAVLATITFALHLIYALEPQAAGPQEAA